MRAAPTSLAGTLITVVIASRTSPEPRASTKSCTDAPRALKGPRMGPNAAVISGTAVVGLSSAATASVKFCAIFTGTSRRPDISRGNPAPTMMGPVITVEARVVKAAPMSPALNCATASRMPACRPKGLSGEAYSTRPSMIPLPASPMVWR
ncbi:hypothetical protein [Mycolicibacterium vanbaalenii]|uniref:hypothetical protein n=1 Tax=Mycolicibacterium vanbaalenii TaxID=110539 RepID=UPI0021F36FFB|nr:hypothetical protein [Mycolicibacterium vanbaalenii]